MNADLMPFIWVIIAFFVLLLLQRWIHTHLHGLSLLLTGKPQRAMIIYAIVLLPGVFLHELSHWIMATLVGVRTGSFSILPRAQPNGVVQLGYVEYYKGRTLGPIRESLIGGAPLLVGTSLIWLIGLHIFTVSDLLTAIRSGNIAILTQALNVVFHTNDFLVWLYLLFAISNAMMPSSSDRRAWPAFVLIMSSLAVGMYLLGIQATIFAQLSELAVKLFGYLSVALSLAIAVDLVFMAFIALLEGIISRLKGVDVIYGQAESPPGGKNITA